MAPSRRLQDLFVVGREFELNDDSGGDPVTVYLKKLSPVEHETAMRRANAARARTIATANAPDSDEYLDTWESVADFDRDGLTLYLVEDRRLTRTQVIEAEFGAEEEWSKDTYLVGLREEWEDRLKEVWATNNEDPDAARVHGELKRFSDTVQKAVEAELEAFQTDLESRSDEALRQQVLEKFLTVKASLAWLIEYRRCEVWLATRERDKKTRVFATREEVDDLPVEVHSALSEAYRALVVDPQEGKGSRGTGSSSRSSEQPASPDMEQDSGPKDAAA